MQFCSSSSKTWDTQAELLTPSKARKRLLTGLYDTAQFRETLKTCEKHGKCLFTLTNQTLIEIQADIIPTVF